MPVAGVAAQEPRTAFLGQRVPHAPEIFPAARRRVLLARAHFHVEHQPQPAHEERVVSVAGPAGFVRVVADQGPLLVAVDGFDRHIEIQNPRPAQGRLPGLLQRARLPGRAGVRVGVGKRTAHAVLAAHPGHAQPLRIDRVGAQGGDMRVTMLSRQNGQRARPQKIGNERRMVAGEGERTSLNPVAKETGGGEELTEENQLAQRRDGRVRIPFDMETPAVRIDRQRPVKDDTSSGGAGDQAPHPAGELPGDRSGVACLISTTNSLQMQLNQLPV